MDTPEKPCRVCTTTTTSLHDFQTLKSSGFGTLSSSPKPASKTSNKLPCPPDGPALGRATWTFLHTMAAYYPDSPSQEHRGRTISFLNSFSHLYPCDHCAQHLRKEMEVRPPDVSGRVGLSNWLCVVHNKVNEVLGKEQFDCRRVLERWSEGPADGSCD
ncbi:hypothetical protein SmJEL517_g05186 [Synchytrium microbalum]|uniref:Sulfhydryl oxidase n=1 Tax=Synchytrium microbalum TaxID=1806994 RepID=A0A507BVF0_9FUNG|nr:uncharacterized protein SmJEL517_g05186 [Synchytrium microbalum]TPX31482.1 hypothetical protein SmJEL517_g05186 [Synchytrium microbalum]